MSALKLFNVVSKACSVSNRRSIHVSAAVSMRELRIGRGLPVNWTSEGPLTDLPDYSYLDGRPTPIGGHQKARMLKQRDNAKKIVESLQQVDFARKRYSDMKAEELNNERLRSERRLKEKGNSK